MRGHIKKRYKSSYSITLDIGKDPLTGKRKQKTYTVKGTLKDAQKKLAELINQINNGTYIQPDKTKLSDYLTRWLDDYAKFNLSPRTAEGYEYIIRKHINPKLGNIDLLQLKPETIQRYYTDKLAHGRTDGTGGLSLRSVRHHHMVLHCALKQAVKWGLLIRNPLDAVITPKPPRFETHTWEDQRLTEFLEASKNTPYYPLFYLALFTGMRRSELLALRWRDIDLIGAQISVNRSMHYLIGGEILFKSPKTEKGRRTIALTPSTCIILKEHQNKRKDESILLGKPLNEDDLIFCHIDSSPLLPNSVTHAWSKLAKRTGLKGMRLHDARHTHATIMMKQGIHPKVVQERLGHSSITITLDTYSHVVPGLQQAAAEKFDEIMKPKLDTPTENSIC